MAETFTIVPDRGFSKQSKPRVNTAKFNDGYSQRIAVGINSLDESWNLTFRNRSITEANTIVSFLQARNAVSYFLWTPPGESTQVKVICPEWSVEYNSEFSKSVSCTFNRVYDI